MENLLKTCLGIKKTDTVLGKGRGIEATLIKKTFNLI